jgi:hypothetical protein
MITLMMETISSCNDATSQKTTVYIFFVVRTSDLTYGVYARSCSYSYLMEPHCAWQSGLLLLRCPLWTVGSIMALNLIKNSLVAVWEGIWGVDSFLQVHRVSPSLDSPPFVFGAKSRATVMFVDLLPVTVILTSQCFSSSASSEFKLFYTCSNSPRNVGTAVWSWSALSRHLIGLRCCLCVLMLLLLYMPFSLYLLHGNLFQNNHFNFPWYARDTSLINTDPSGLTLFCVCLKSSVKEMFLGYYGNQGTLVVSHTFSPEIHYFCFHCRHLKTCPLLIFGTVNLLLCVSRRPILIIPQLLYRLQTTDYSPVLG